MLLYYGVARYWPGFASRVVFDFNPLHIWGFIW